MSGSCMEFPASVEEFMEQYKIVDSEEIYTNGAELVPIFRMQQWFEHLKGVPSHNYQKDCEMLKIACEELRSKCEELKYANKELSEISNSKTAHIEQLKLQNEHLLGKIEGLEFSIRCNGVSGSEVKSNV